MRESFKPLVSAAACGALLAGVGNTAVAQDLAPVPKAVMANFITAGLVDPNGKVPALNAVSGSGVPNVSVAIPRAILQHGTVYTYLLSSQNVTFNGTCTDSYTLFQGSGASKVVLDARTIHTYSCAPGTTWEWAINGLAVPNSPGLATLQGVVKFGRAMVVTNTTVLIQ